MPIQYCLVQGGQVIDGPKILPRSWMNISGLNLLSPAELKTHGWLTYSNTKPEFNKDTQYLTSEKVVSSGAVDESYTINSYTTEQLAARLSTEKTKMLSQINIEVNTFINSYYDSGTQQSFTAIYTQQDTTTEVKTYLDPVLVWIQSIMTYYYGKKGSINATTTIASLRAVEWDFSTFIETKPDVTLEALLSQ